MSCSIPFYIGLHILLPGHYGLTLLLFFGIQNWATCTNIWHSRVLQSFLLHSQVGIGNWDRFWDIFLGGKGNFDFVRGQSREQRCTCVLFLVSGLIFLGVSTTLFSSLGFGSRLATPALFWRLGIGTDGWMDRVVAFRVVF